MEKRIELKKSRIDDDFANDELDYIVESVKDKNEDEWDEWDMQEGVFDNKESPSKDTSSVIEDPKTISRIEDSKTIEDQQQDETKSISISYVEDQNNTISVIKQQDQTTQQPSSSLIQSSYLISSPETFITKPINQKKVKTKLELELEQLREENGIDPVVFTVRKDDEELPPHKDLYSDTEEQEKYESDKEEVRFNYRQEMQDNMDQMESLQNEPEIEKQLKINQQLKDELEAIFNQMEMQLSKMQKARVKEYMEKQKQREQLELKSQQIKANQKRYSQLKKEIESTWLQLESTYKIGEINQMESELQIKQNELQIKIKENKIDEQIVMRQSRDIKSINNFEGANQSKIRNVNQQISESKQKIKQMQKECNENEKQMLKNHEIIQDGEQKIKRMALIVKETKKRAKQGNNSEQDEDVKEKIEKLKKEIKELEHHKRLEEKNQNLSISKMENDLIQSKFAIRELKLQLKEKDNEVKITELKIKELKQFIPKQNKKDKDYDHDSLDTPLPLISPPLSIIETRKKKPLVPRFSSQIHFKKQPKLQTIEPKSLIPLPSRIASHKNRMGSVFQNALNAQKPPIKKLTSHLSMRKGQSQLLTIQQKNIKFQQETPEKLKLPELVVNNSHQRHHSMNINSQKVKMINFQQDVDKNYEISKKKNRNYLLNQEKGQVTRDNWFDKQSYQKHVEEQSNVTSIPLPKQIHQDQDEKVIVKEQLIEPTEFGTVESNDQDKIINLQQNNLSIEEDTIIADDDKIIRQKTLIQVLEEVKKSTDMVRNIIKDANSQQNLRTEEEEEEFGSYLLTENVPRNKKI